MDNLILIGLAGTMKSGKDTVADYLVRSYGFTKIGFADAIRNQVTTAFELDNDLCLTAQEEKELPNHSLALIYCAEQGFVAWLQANHQLNDDAAMPRTPRWIQQKWGDYIRATKGWDFFINAVRHKILWKVSQAHEMTPIVISGVRFAASAPNPTAEADLIRSLGGQVWHVQRPCLEYASDHSTEAPLPIEDNDRILINGNTIDYLLQEVDFKLNDLLRTRVRTLAPL